MKKFALALILGLIFNSTAAFAFYNDVPEDHQYYSAIKTLYDLNLLPAEDSFKPDDKVSKEDLFKFILNYAKVDPQEENPDFIQTAIDYNLISPKSSYLENPEQAVKKHSALKELFTQLGVGINPLFNRSKFKFTDIGPNSPISAVAQKAQDLGIIEAKNTNKFQAFKEITHGELAYYLTMIYNYQEVQPETIIIKTNGNSSSKYQYKPETFLNIWDTLKRDHLNKNDFNFEKLEVNAIDGLLESVNDPYTTYQDADQANQFLDQLSSEIEGIGAMLELIEDQITVISPLKNSPAEKAGLKANDIIIKVDGEDILGQSMPEVISKIKGPSGTTVKITVLRDKSEKTISITRAKIQVYSVESEMLESESGKQIGYISIINFAEKTVTEFKSAAETLIKENPDGFIIDLRNNPGGYLDAAVLLTGMFMEKTSVAVTLDQGDHQENYQIPGTKLLSDYQIVVLVNEGSASASEILAGALQDHERAKIVGTTTFGKGTAQNIKTYADGSLFKYTIAKWLTPDGHDIDKKGIIPDLKVENTGEKDRQLEMALIQFK